MDCFIKCIKLLVNFFMTVIILIGGIFIILFLVGIEPFVVESGSMEPVIPTYSLVMINKNTKYEEIKENDIIAFNSELGAKVVHRAVKITSDGIETKGESNKITDGISTNKNNFIGKEVFYIPKAGYVVKLIQTSRGKIILGTFAVVLVLAGILIGEPDSNKKKNQNSNNKAI